MTDVQLYKVCVAQMIVTKVDEKRNNFTDDFLKFNIH